MPNAGNKIVISARPHAFLDGVLQWQLERLESPKGMTTNK